MVIIYGGIQPRGLVLSVHKITVDTSRNRTVVRKGQTTPRPTRAPTPPPIRGTVPPRSKWDDHELPFSKLDNLEEEEDPTDLNVIDRVIEAWAKKTFKFGRAGPTTTVASTKMSPEKRQIMQSQLLSTLEKLMSMENGSKTLNSSRLIA
jgi:hypothetical protein